jgi:nucleotide-binding universal stress UspA family protein
MFSVIAVGTDNSPRAHAAVEYAAGLAESCGAKLRIIVVHRLFPYSRHGAYGVDVLTSRDAEPDVAAVEAHEQLLVPVTRRLRRRGIDVEVLVVSGAPPARLIREASEADADVLVVGDRGLRSLLGGVAAAVVRRAPMPVLVVRTGTAKRSGLQTGSSPNC